MGIILPHTGGARAFTGNLFDSPQAAGRKITAGFTYLQRIGKGASYDVWFPAALREKLAGRATRDADFPAQWAAVRQFELLHESGNYKIYDLDPDNLRRCFTDLSKSMRAGGYRVTVATLGSYSETAADELEILDQRLQERIARLIHMLYLEGESAAADAGNDQKLAAGGWNYLRELPHVGMVLGAENLFLRDEDENEEKPRRKSKSGSASRGPNAAARQFFRILDELPQGHIAHDTAIGLQLPELNGENEWNYIANPEETLGAFNRVLGDLFDKFNHISLGRLNGREGAGAEIKSSTYHMRAYGDRLDAASTRFYQSAALALT